MEKTQTLEEFYLAKLDWMPNTLKKEIGHFNVFVLDPFVGPKAKPIPYSRKDYFKISLIVGKNRVHYADKSVEIENCGLLFANPLIPYNWEPLEGEQSGFFCIFTEEFFNQFGNIKEYPVFQPGTVPVFNLTPEQHQSIAAIFKQMLSGIGSDYAYKYDQMRNLVFQIIHQVQQMQPSMAKIYAGSNAAVRMSSLFMELLERQFPIESTGQRIIIKTPAEFADQLSVHVNHLNRSLKKITGKTTSQLIAERIAQEARGLLKHTNWNIAEISWSLGFDEPSHFIKFFKKNVAITPATFRTQ